MIKKLLLSTVSMFLLVLLVAGVSAIDITNCIELQDINNDLTATYTLLNDIDCTDTVNWNGGLGFDPLGDAGTKFSGYLNASRRKISNLYINRPSEDYVGLFGYISSTGKVTGLKLSYADVTGRDYTGGIFGRSDNKFPLIDSTIESVGEPTSTTGYTGNAITFTEEGQYLRVKNLDFFPTNSSDFSFNFRFKTATAGTVFAKGGLIGAVDSFNQRLGVQVNDFGAGSFPLSIFNSTFNNLLDNQWHHVSVTKEGSLFTIYIDGQYYASRDYGADHCGNDCGENYDLYIGSSTGGFSTNINGTFDEIKILNRSLNSSEVSELNTTGTISDATGLVIDNDLETAPVVESTVDRSYTLIDVTGRDYVGGIGGYNTGYLTKVYSKGTPPKVPTGVTGDDYIGGVVGYNDGSIINSFSWVETSGTGDYIGSFVGYNDGLIKKNYGKGKVNSNSPHALGLVGSNGTFGGTFMSYWDVETTGKSASAGGNGKSSAQLQLASTYVGWDLIETWIVNSYPILLWNPANCTQIESDNFTVSGGYLISEDDSPYLNQYVDLYANWESNTNPSATGVIEDTSSSIASTTSWFTIFLTIGAMVVLILLTIIIIVAIRGSGLMSLGGA